MLEPTGASSNFWYVKILRFLFSGFLGKKQGQKFFKFLQLLALKGRNYGSGALVGGSGEIALLSKLKSKVERPVVLDVGANEGDYAKQVLHFMPGAQIYCFEPSPETYKILQKNLAGGGRSFVV